MIHFLWLQWIGHKSLKQYRHSTFRIKDLGPPKYFLGIEIARLDLGISLSQRKFVLEIISKVSLSRCKPAIIPIKQSVKLTTVDYDIGSSSNIDDLILEDPSWYQRLVGKLIYLIVTRPNICHVVQTLSQFMQLEGVSHEWGFEGREVFKEMSRAWNTSLLRLQFGNDSLLWHRLCHMSHELKIHHWFLY